MESFDQGTIENHSKYRDRMTQLTARSRSRGYAAANLKSKPDKTHMHMHMHMHMHIDSHNIIQVQ